MKYMVMECHLSYAVVLDEKGRFIKVANLHYEVGQTVTQVVELTPPKDNASSKRSHLGQWYTLAAMAACLLLVIAFIFQPRNAPYASVYMTINPQVRIDVDRRDNVIGLESLNEDGHTLIENYSYPGKNLDQVMEELVAASIHRGYLLTGGKITLTLEAENSRWLTQKEAALNSLLKETIPPRMSVTVEVTGRSDTPSSTTVMQTVPDDEPEQLYIPPVSQEALPEDEYGDSAYGNEPIIIPTVPAEGSGQSVPPPSVEQTPVQQAPPPVAEQQTPPAVSGGDSPYQEAPVTNSSDSPYQDDSGDDGQSAYDD